MIYIVDAMNMIVVVMIEYVVVIVFNPEPKNI